MAVPVTHVSFPYSDLLRQPKSVLAFVDHGDVVELATFRLPEVGKMPIQGSRWATAGAKEDPTLFTLCDCRHSSRNR